MTAARFDLLHVRALPSLFTERSAATPNTQLLKYSDTKERQREVDKPERQMHLRYSSHACRINCVGVLNEALENVENVVSRLKR